MLISNACIYCCLTAGGNKGIYYRLTSDVTFHQLKLFTRALVKYDIAFTCAEAYK
ncbi:hypothetical protein [Vibrio rotiferianus]|uniref:hypothetical protein n=1 Tax=Vibrio rotiferianus TaxID=190895 RepID=UPI00406AA1CF